MVTLSPPPSPVATHPSTGRVLVAAGSWWERLPPTQPASRAGNYTSVRHQFTGHSRTARYFTLSVLSTTHRRTRSSGLRLRFSFRPHFYFITLLNEQEKKHHKYFSSNRRASWIELFLRKHNNISFDHRYGLRCAREYIINYNILRTSAYDIDCSL